MPKMYVRGLFYDRSGEETLKFTIDSELIDKVLTIEGEDEIDAFFENNNLSPIENNLLSGVIGDEDVAENWNNHKAFNVTLEEFVFGVGPTKEAATMQWSEAMEDNGGDDSWYEVSSYAESITRYNMNDKVYVVEIVSRTTVEVTNVADWKEAKAVVEEMYNNGDACATLGGATFSVVEVKDGMEDED